MKAPIGQRRDQQVTYLANGKTCRRFTGIHWALTVMTTLGFGDITFHSDLGSFAGSGSPA